MDIKLHIATGNYESLGKYYLKKGLKFAFLKSYGKAFEFIKEGLKILTCDCMRGWTEEYLDKIKFNDLEVQHRPSLEYYFVKAFYFSYRRDKKGLYLALDAIDRYLSDEKSDLGYYVQGKILSHLGEIDNALKSFQRAINYNKNSRNYYRIGRIKEEKLYEDGLSELCISFIRNPFCPCCGRFIQKAIKSERINFHTGIDYKDNILLNSFFLADDEWKFQVLYENLILKTTHFDIKTRSNAMLIINQFITTIMNGHIEIVEEDYYTDFEESYYDHRADNENMFVELSQEGNYLSQPIFVGDPRYDRDENPWIDVFGEGEEAEVAYWNTQ